MRKIIKSTITPAYSGASVDLNTLLYEHLEDGYLISNVCSASGFNQEGKLTVTVVAVLEKCPSKTRERRATTCSTELAKLI